jgi:hypothetical protein
MLLDTFNFRSEFLRGKTQAYMLLKRRIYKCFDNTIAWGVSYTSRSISRHITLARVSIDMSKSDVLYVTEKCIHRDVHPILDSCISWEHYMFPFSPCVGIFTQGTTTRNETHMSAVGSCVFRLSACRQSSFPGSAPAQAALSASSARQPSLSDPTPDANKAHHSLLFCFLYTTTPPFTTYRHLTLHTLFASPIHSLHSARHLCSSSTIDTL